MGVANFKYLDANGVGSIPYSYLEEAGLCSKEIVDKLRARYDVNHDNEIDATEFVSILCPVGFRPHPASDCLYDADGELLRCVVGTLASHQFKGYLYEKWLAGLPESLRHRLTPALPDYREV